VLSTASVALARGRSANDENLRAFAKAESLMRSLIEEMRADLRDNPTSRGSFGISLTTTRSAMYSRKNSSIT
jgi:hypothetical protein